MEVFECDSCVRGYHEYSRTWTANMGEILPCVVEANNPKNRYAVSITKAGIGIVGHVPRKMSAMCFLYIVHHHLHHYWIA